MSANNMITIDRTTFEVMEVDAETGYGNTIGKAKNLEEAVDIADKAMKESEIEYGIHFINKPRTMAELKISHDQIGRGRGKRLQSLKDLR